MRAALAASHSHQLLTRPSLGRQPRRYRVCPVSVMALFARFDFSSLRIIPCARPTSLQSVLNPLAVSSIVLCSAALPRSPCTICGSSQCNCGIMTRASFISCVSSCSWVCSLRFVQEVVDERGAIYTNGAALCSVLLSEGGGALINPRLLPKF